jgi:hypothetical protein
MPLNSMFDISDRIGAEGAQARQNMLARQAGNAMAGGDYNGAANVFYKGGDLASGQKVQEYSDAQRKQHAEGAQRIAHGIRGLVASGVDPNEAYQHAMQYAPALGIDPGELQKLKPYYDKDPKAFLDFVDQQAKHELQIVNRGNGGYDVVDKQSGAKIRGVDPRYEQKYVTLPEGAKAIPIPGTGDTPAGGAAPAEPLAAPAAAPVADPAAAVDGAVRSIGATVTSGLRSPAHNAQVGGVPNSAHLTGQARDIVPPPNMTLAQLGADIQRRVPGAKVLVEKDHVHVQWRGVGGAAAGSAHSDPPGTLYGNPKEPKPEETPLSPAAVAMVGQQYLSLGPPALQNMGQGKVGVANKNAVMEWVAKTAREAGTSNPQLVARFAQNKANVAALSQNTKSLTAISASEHTLDANLDYALSFAKRGVGPTGVPMFDTPINKLRIALGSTDAKNLDNLLTTTGNEYARILTTATGTGGGATSDSAREEAHKLLHSGMTLRQLTEAIKIAKTEAANRKASYVTENARLTSEISGIPQAAPSAPAQSAPAAPKVGQMVKGYRFLGGDPSNRNSWAKP